LPELSGLPVCNVRVPFYVHGKHAAGDASAAKATINTL
jgi:hypothetical protein